MAAPNGRVVRVILGAGGSEVDLDVNGFGAPPSEEERQLLGTWILNGTKLKITLEIQVKINAVLTLL